MWLRMLSLTEYQSPRGQVEGPRDNGCDPPLRPRAPRIGTSAKLGTPNLKSLGQLAQLGGAGEYVNQSVFKLMLAIPPSNFCHWPGYGRPARERASRASASLMRTRLSAFCDDRP